LLESAFMVAITWLKPRFTSSQLFEIETKYKLIICRVILKPMSR